jgi:DNA-binding response OmpR family regulator
MENDEFLREIIGNLLHKKGAYVLNASTIEEGLEETSSGKEITTVILGTSCPEFKGKESIGYIKKRLGNPDTHFFIINHLNQEIPGIALHMQMRIENLSIQKIINAIEI